jgi:hypothetical protein
MDRLPLPKSYKPARGRMGPRHTPESLEKILRGHLGRPLSEATKQKLRDSYRERLWTKDSGLPRPGAANGGNSTD